MKLLQQINSEKQATINDLQSQLTAKTDENTALQAANEEQRARIENLRAEVGHETDQNAALQAANQELRARIDDIEINIANKIAENEELKRRINEVEAKYASNTNNVNQKVNKITILDSNAIEGLEEVKIIACNDNITVREMIKKELVVLKQMKRVNFENLKNLMKEYEILNMLNHPNILKTYGFLFGDDKTPSTIVLERCFQNIGSAVIDGFLSKENIAFSVFQIAQGMKYLHFMKIIHRDLKPGNILINEDGTIKIGDFGISKLMEGTITSNTQGIGTMNFMAPEMMNELDYNEKVDVYSFGVLIYFIVKKEMPKITPMAIMKGRKAEIPNDITDFTKQLINDCWETDPDTRPSFKEICERLDVNYDQIIDLTAEEINNVKIIIDQYKLKIPHYETD